MELGTVMSIVQTILTTIQCCDQLLKGRSFSGYRSAFDSLKSTLNTVNAVLQDAEAKQDALTFQQKLYVEELRDAVYDADDVLDEFFTLVQRKKLFVDGGKASEKVLSFLSRFTPLAFKLSKKVREVSEKLEGIATRKNLLSMDVDYKPIKFRKEETCSYVYADDIIGRGPDLEKIVGMLLDSDVQQDVSFLSVVGIGGLGKTALAQLVYNDPRVTSAFSLRLWTCVSDEGSDHLDIKATLCKILASATDKRVDGSLTMDGVQSKLHGHLAGKKYLLVLDDVWNENRAKLMELVAFLKVGEKGSWILVTTRSRETATIMGDRPPYELQGLTEDDSWSLFQKVAFEPHQMDPLSDELTSIGKKIVMKCVSVPLAIKTMGSLLYGQPVGRWLSLQEKVLASVGERENGIKPILKLSYHHLKSHLKSCFTYCALFPKDFRLNRKELIRLWMAQGYIVPEEGREMEDVGEEYFSVLLRRCFFQDVKKREGGDVVSCKMHDLMHDIAQEVVGNEILIANGDRINIDRKVRHLGLLRSKYSQFTFEKTGIRTFHRVDTFYFTLEQFPVDLLLENCVCLRTLDLSRLDLERLPDSIGKLLHLRLLNLSGNKKLEGLPEAVTKLHNLQTLDLSLCRRLKEWPKDVSKLVNLRVLDTDCCDGLTYMPLGLCKLTSLHTLGTFVADHESGRLKQCVLEELEGLKPLNNLKGHLDIRIGVPENAKYSSNGHGREEAYLRGKQHLTVINIEFREGEGYGNREYEEALLDQLQPHPSVVTLCVRGYHGVRMPRWPPPGDGVNSSPIHLPHLVRLKITNCKRLRSVKGWIEHLPALEKLYIENCPNLVGNSEEEEGDDGVPWRHLPPTLRSLTLMEFEDMENLPKGVQYCTSLQSLVIYKCRKLKSLPTWMPSLTSLATLELLDCCNELKERCEKFTGEDWPLIQHILSVDVQCWRRRSP